MVLRVSSYAFVKCDKYFQNTARNAHYFNTMQLKDVQTICQENDFIRYRQPKKVIIENVTKTFIAIHASCVHMQGNMNTEENIH